MHSLNDLCKKYREKDYLENRPKSERLRKTTSKQDKMIVDTSIQSRRMTAAQISLKLGLNSSISMTNIIDEYSYHQCPYSPISMTDFQSINRFRAQERKFFIYQGHLLIHSNYRC